MVEPQNFVNSITSSKITKEEIKFHLDSEEEFIIKIIDISYSELQDKRGDNQYLRERMIVAAGKRETMRINSKLLSTMPGCEHIYVGADSVIKRTGEQMNKSFANNSYFNRFSSNAYPNYEIKLKVGAPIMLLCTLNRKGEVGRGTRVMITQLRRTRIVGQVLNGKASGRFVIIKKKITRCKIPTTNYTFFRRQFPVQLCFATISRKSVKQGLSNVGIYHATTEIRRSRLFHWTSYSQGERIVKTIILLKEEEDNEYYTQHSITEELFENVPMVDHIVRQFEDPPSY